MGKLIESLEKYLMAIYKLAQSSEFVKVEDISNYLKIGGPSVADAVETLAERGFVDYVPYGEITLTTKGIDAVELKLYRHNVISSFLNKVLEIPKEKADLNANAIEYSMTEDVLTKLVHFLDFMEQCTCREPRWINSCQHSLENGQVSDKCTSCRADKQGCSSCCGGCGNHV